MGARQAGDKAPVHREVLSRLPRPYDIYFLDGSYDCTIYCDDSAAWRGG
jgi:hypothetical protein